MAPQATNSQGSALKAVTQRISSTPTRQLPHVVPFLTVSIQNSSRLLSTSDNRRAAGDSSDSGVLVHKFKTQVSALLQDKSVEARWSAVVLIKATLEAGGWEILHGVGSWIRGLIAILAVSNNSPSDKGLGSRLLLN